ncbi:MAG: phosphohistidine phosphatase SixA [Synergistaceae bacterium]|jgi:phosphohistidine phosphatase|nr:phosphohistidine phosphatase SixA [Synergistaceae bacterium]
MKIILMRHGDAEIGGVDSKRRLSEEGRREACLAGEFLLRLGETPGAILHSELRRSAQTAEIVARRLGSGVRTSLCHGLLPGDPVSSFADRLLEEQDDVMAVGHQPFVSSLAAFLLTGTQDGLRIKFPTGALASLERLPEPSGSSGVPCYSLRFHATAKSISRLVGGWDR